MPIRPVEKEHLPEQARAAYEEIERRTGRVSTFYRMLAHKPEILRTFDAFYRAVWAPGALPPKLKELAYLRASILNGCAY
ncbi:MAG TPA: carboxymuconolactone decarboxylase family protein [Thermomicrobiales bacterium]|nr:carboxymuconolactone decarboxylase family protein [Thermomicrobiales bacterium]